MDLIYLKDRAIQALHNANYAVGARVFGAGYFRVTKVESVMLVGVTKVWI